MGSQRCNVADRRVVRVFEQRYTFDGKEVGSGTMDSSHIGKVRVLNRPELLFETDGVIQVRALFAPICREACVVNKIVESISEIDDLLVDVANSLLSCYVAFNGNTLSLRLSPNSCICEFIRSLLNDIEATANDEHFGAIQDKGSGYSFADTLWRSQQ